MAVRPSIRCEGCGGTEFDNGDDGFFYCRDCGGQSQDVLETACADEDVFTEQGALYSMKHVRHSQSQPRSQPFSQLQLDSSDKANKETILLSLMRNLDAGYTVKEEEGRPYGFNDEVYQPMDFGCSQSIDERDMADGIRLRYMQGLQLMIQMQCKDLVESFGVSPRICGVVGVVWLRYLAELRVFEENWADKAIYEAETAARKRCAGREEDNAFKSGESGSCTFSRRRPKFIWASSLRKKIPIHTSLAITFLGCHIAREPILPTDLVKWAMEGKLPYISAFVDIDKSLGNPSAICPLSSRFLFRPVRSVGSWQLEATAGSIARCIGLHLPSVNFFAIAQRYLMQLSLPVSAILPYACRIYEWSMPAELWLSGNASRLPTRACVMSILIVATRMLYGIHGNGVWERSLLHLQGSSTNDHKSCFNNDLGCLNSYQSSFNEKLHVKGCQPTCHKKLTINAEANGGSSHYQASHFGTTELLYNLEEKYDEMTDMLDYAKDFRSYLKYCKDIAFAGITVSYDEERLIERLWNIFDKREDDAMPGKTGFSGENRKRSRDEKHVRTEEVTKNGKESCKISTVDTSVSNKSRARGSEHISSDGHTSESSQTDDARDVALPRMKLNMKENGFEYLPPRVRQHSTDYLHYRRKIFGGKLQFVAHADYYILLRACAKLAQLDVRIMHLGVLKLERRLSWIEQRIKDGSTLFFQGRCNEGNMSSPKR